MNVRQVSPVRMPPADPAQHRRDLLPYDIRHVQLDPARITTE
jgi:hypothetical protein